MTELHSEAAASDVLPAPAPAEAAPAGAAAANQPVGDPVPLGLLVFALGGTVLGISLLGYVPAAVQPGSVMPIVFAATGLGLLITTLWAARLGETFVATVLGAFAGFWLSYAAMVLGLTHNWYGIPAADVTHTIGQYLIAWDVVIFMLWLVTFRIPLLFTLILGSGVVAVTLLAIGTLEASTSVNKVGAVFVLLFSALGYYGYLSGAIASVGGKPLPVGQPVVSMLGK
jgi:uncharacterized protein